MCLGDELGAPVRNRDSHDMSRLVLGCNSIINMGFMDVYGRYQLVMGTTLYP